MFNRLLKSESFSDVMIKCQSVTFQAHRTLLVAQSTYFRSLLLDDDDNVRCPPASHVTLDNIDPDTLKLILNFIYSGRLTNIPEASVKLLKEAADKLGIKEIVIKCKKQELVNTTPTSDNCMDGWKTAMTLNDDDLCKKFSQIALTHFSEVTTCPNFVSLDLEIIKVYLSHIDLQVDSPDMILPAALDWVRADQTERITLLPVLLKSIPLYKMDTNVLKYLLMGEPMFRQHNDSRTILQEAINVSEVSPSATISKATPVRPPSTVIPVPSRVAVRWTNANAIKLYDASMREQIKSVNPPTRSTDIQRTGCCLTDDELFVAGQKKLLSYHLTINEWQEKADLHYYRINPTLVTTSNKIFILGGHDGKSRAVCGVEEWNCATKHLEKGGNLIGDQCGFASCCRLSNTDIAVWGVMEANLLLQVYSTTQHTVTHSLSVPAVFGGRGIVSVSDHIIMCDSSSTYTCRIRDLYDETIGSAKKLMNFKPPDGEYNGLIVSEDGQEIIALCDGQCVMSAAVNDVISDAACGWSEVSVKWTQNKDEYCAPGAVCSSYRPQ